MTFIGLEITVLESLFTLCARQESPDLCPVQAWTVASFFSKTWHYLAFESSNNTSKILLAFYYQDGYLEVNNCPLSDLLAWASDRVISPWMLSGKHPVFLSPSH